MAKKKKKVVKAKAKPRKTAPVAKLPGPKDIAAALGVSLTQPLKPAEVQRLRKALPGYVGLLDDAATQLAEDRDLLNIPAISPADLTALHTQVQSLLAREAVVEAVYTSVYQQRLQLDDQGMGALQKIARRIQALTEDDAGLPARWKFLLDFLGGFRGGGRPPADPAKPAS